MAPQQNCNTSRRIAIVAETKPDAAAKAALAQKVEDVFPFTPRGLLRAVRTLPDVQKRMKRCNGKNAPTLWVEVAGHRVPEAVLDSLVDFVHEDDVRFRERMFLPIETRTTKARKIIANALSA